MTFKDWLKLRKGKNSAIGDLANDVETDKCFPDTDILHTMVEHLEGHDADDKAIKVLKSSYYGWKRENKG